MTAADQPERTAVPGDPLPPVPESAYASDATPLPAPGYAIQMVIGGGIMRVTIHLPDGTTYAGDLPRLNGWIS